MAIVFRTAKDLKDHLPQVLAAAEGERPASGVAGDHSGPKPLWISELTKVSHSMKRYRARLPCAGASPACGA